jgi:hypothetical protein
MLNARYQIRVIPKLYNNCKLGFHSRIILFLEARIDHCAVMVYVYILFNILFTPLVLITVNFCFNHHVMWDTIFLYVRCKYQTFTFMSLSNHHVVFKMYYTHWPSGPYDDLCVFSYISLQET